MKKVILLALIVVISTILFADVSWGNGVPLYEGNYINCIHSARISENNLFLTWLEADSGVWKIELLKTDSTGNPIWQEPITISEQYHSTSEPKIIHSENGDNFIAYYDYSNLVIYKVDDSGTILWNNSVDGYNYNFSTPENGGIMCLKIKNIDNSKYLCGSYLSSQGEVIWNNKLLVNLPVQTGLSKVISYKFINNQLSVIVKIGSTIYFMSFDENGNLIYLSNNYEVTFHGDAKLMNDKFYYVFNDTNDNELKMWTFDLDGNSLSGENPFSLHTLNGYMYEHLFNNNGHFYCLGENNSQKKVLLIDYSGSFLSEYDFTVSANSPDIQYFDQDADFISVSWVEDFHNKNSIIQLNDSGISDPINFNFDYLGSGCFMPDKFYLGNGYTMVGIKLMPESKIVTFRCDESPSVITYIKDIEVDDIMPTLANYPNGISAFWYSGNHRAIMKQSYDHYGQPQYDENGSIILETNDRFYVSDNSLFCFQTNNEENTASIQRYDFFGNLAWQNPIQLTLSNEYHFYTGIKDFYSGYLLYTITAQENSDGKVIELNYFNNDGLVWDNPVEINIDYSPNIFYRRFLFKGKNLIYQSNDIIHCLEINEDGSIEHDFTIANNSPYITVLGDDNDFFIYATGESDSESNLYYFHNGTKVWDEPMTYTHGSVYPPMFDESGFYLTDVDFQHTLNVNYFDYDKNYIAEKSFNYSDSSFGSVSPYIKGNYLIFFNVNHLSGNDAPISYLVYNKIENHFIFDTPVPITEREDVERLNSIKFDDNFAYLEFNTGYQYDEGDYLRDHYIQKVDFTSLVGNNNEVAEHSDYELSNYPNPFNPLTTISFTIPIAAEVKLNIYNIKGQKVKTLTNEKYSKGKYNLTWNGLSDKNEAVSSGVYFYKLNINGKTEDVKKCLLLK